MKDMGSIEAKDYRVTVKVRNNRILKAIEESGGNPGGKWCEANGLSYIATNDFINMKTSPLSAGGGISSRAEKLCEVLNKLPQDLWSNEQLYPLEKNFSEMEMSYSQIVALLPSDQQSYLSDFSGIEKEQTKALIDMALSTLPERSRAVIRMRFDEGLTLEQCGNKMGMSSSRVKQIEDRALRHLRHPKISADLRDDFVNTACHNEGGVP